MHLTWHLLAAKLRIARATWLQDRASRGRALLLGTVGLAFVAAVALGADWFFAKCLAVEPIGEVVVRRVLAMTLLATFTLLAFSSLVDAIQTLYLAGDLELLVPRPIAPEPLFTARFVETAAHASWMLVPVAAPVFVVAGRHFQAGAGYYLTLLLVALTLVTLAAAGGVATSLVLTRALPARRARLLLVVAGALAAGVIALLLRSLRPEQFMNPDLRAPLLEALEALQGTDASWLPSTWAMNALWPHLAAAATPAGHPRLLLVTAAVAAFFATGWLFRWFHPAAFSRSKEGSPGDDHPLAGPAPREPALARLVAAAVHRGGRHRFTVALAHKDRLVFARDPAQWSQLLILAAIGALYVLNFRYIRAVSGTGLVADLGLHFLNLGLSGFVSLALAARFVFPAVSLEGPSFWLVRTAPVTVAEFLAAKAASLSLPLVLFADLLVVTTHVALGIAPLLVVVSVLTVTPLTVGLVHLGIGLGARHPSFRSDNAAAIATGVGGLLFMLSGSALLVTVVLLSILPTSLVARLAEGRHLHHPEWVLLGLVAALATVAVPLVVGRWARRLGARHLTTLERI